MKNQKITLAAALTLTLLSGCAGFKDNQLPIVNEADFSASTNTKTKVFTRWSIDTDVELNDTQKAMHSAASKERFEEILVGSDCCTVVEGPLQADVVVTGKTYIEDHSDAMAGALLTGLTLYTIPSWVTITPKISAEVSSGEKKRTYSFQDSMTMVQWLPMIFALPFTGNPISEGEKMENNVFKNLVLNIQNDGLLK